MTLTQDSFSREIEDLREQLAQRQRANEALTQARDAYQHRVNLLEVELASVEKALKQVEAEHRARIEDIAILTASFCAQLDDPEKTAVSQATKFSLLQEQVDALSRELHDVAHHRQSLLNSTSWRITRPLRAVAERFRRS